MYLDADGKLRPRHRAGAWAAGVPGTVRGLGLAHARFGKTPWAELVRPAVRLAREGFPISADLAGSLNRQLAPRLEPERRPSRRRDDFGRLGDFPESVAAFGKPDRTPLEGRATGSFSPIWPPRSIESPTAGPTSSTPVGPPRLIAGYMDGARRLGHARRPEILPGQAPSARSHNVSRLRRLTASAHRHRAGLSSARCSTSSNGST